jgi:hypothetical protein
MVMEVLIEINSEEIKMEKKLKEDRKNIVSLLLIK